MAVDMLGHKSWPWLHSRGVPDTGPTQDGRGSCPALWVPGGLPSSMAWAGVELGRRSVEHGEVGSGLEEEDLLERYCCEEEGVVFGRWVAIL